MRPVLRKAFALVPIGRYIGTQQYHGETLMPSSSALTLSATKLPPRSALRRIALLDVVLPFLAVVTLLHNSVAPLAAYAVGSIFPASSIVVSWLRRRSFDYLGLGVLGGIASALAMAVVTGDPRFGLVRAARFRGVWHRLPCLAGDKAAADVLRRTLPRDRRRHGPDRRLGRAPRPACLPQSHAPPHRCLGLAAGRCMSSVSRLGPRSRKRRT